LITPVKRTDPQSVFYCKRILRCKKNAHKKKKKGVKEEEEEEEEEVRMLYKLAKEIHLRLQKTNKNPPGSGILSQDQSGRRRRRRFCGGSFRGSRGKEDCSCKIAAETIVVIVNCKFDEKKQQLLTLICRRKQVSSQG
jgi:hypothetical protein